MVIRSLKYSQFYIERENRKRSILFHPVKICYFILFETQAYELRMSLEYKKLSFVSETNYNRIGFYQIALATGYLKQLLGVLFPAS